MKQRQRMGIAGTVEISNMKETDYAYCAGLIDSDGTIYIDRFTDKRKSHSLYNYVLRVKVGQSDEESVRWLSEVFGGKYRLYVGRASGKYNRKGLYYWAANNQKAAAFLRHLLPYLKIKKKQAVLAIVFAGILLNRNTGKSLTHEQRTERERCAIKMRQLNQRQVA
jgi:hypothetical protein